MEYFACPKITECLCADKGNTMSDKNRTEKAEFTVLCLIQDGNRILLQNRVKEDWKGDGAIWQKKSRV